MDNLRELFHKGVSSITDMTSSNDDAGSALPLKEILNQTKASIVSQVPSTSHLRSVVGENVGAATELAKKLSDQAKEQMREGAAELAAKAGGPSSERFREAVALGKAASVEAARNLSDSVRHAPQAMKHVQDSLAAAAWTTTFVKRTHKDFARYLFYLATAVLAYFIVKTFGHDLLEDLPRFPSRLMRFIRSGVTKTINLFKDKDHETASISGSQGEVTVQVGGGANLFKHVQDLMTELKKSREEQDALFQALSRQLADLDASIDRRLLELLHVLQSGQQPKNGLD